jgi:L-aminopeptidase/D-esterase-like protein
MKGLTDIPGIRVGHASNLKAITGCTVVLCEGGAVAGVDIRGSASGTQEVDVLNPLHVSDRVHAITLAGGSAYGLEAAAGVRRYLEQRKVGFSVGGGMVVPLVPAAIIFDLHIGDGRTRPTREMGEAAAAAASADAVVEGSVGAGTGATVGKIFGMARAMKSGVGTFSLKAGNAMVAALAVVNALGDIRDPASGHIIAGARQSTESHEFSDSQAAMANGKVAGFDASNTTLVVVATDARLSKTGATKLAQLSGLGIARAIYPVNTMSDGDTVFALSTGDVTANIDVLGAAAADAVVQAILRAVRSAGSLGGVPSYLGL